ncbi:MAG: hypothetical protein K8E66_09590 [Phycisphaerales bacterium]|nr:hypothetical protein [Phycisphaerales bacterium]
MKFGQVFQSQYFRGADLAEDFVGTITNVGTELVGEKDERRVVSFEESNKKLVLNRTNWNKAADVLGEDDDANWVGRRIRLRRERVPFKGDIVDAVRVDSPESPF